MCGIVAYVGKNKCRNFILEGLSRLEYRGYDSAGFVCVDEHHKHLSFAKEVGRVSQLKKTIDSLGYDGHVGMGHTRWATHGVADKANAHPQFDCQKSLAVIHNGIIEGSAPIRDRLKLEGHAFHSATDTEVAAHLFGSLIPLHVTLKAAVVALLAQLEGAYAFVFMLEQYPDQLIVMRRRSPLSVGLGDGESFVSSDPIVFSDITNKVLHMPDNSFAFIKADTIELFDFSGKPLPLKIEEFNHKFDLQGKNGFEHYMLKEIYEQKHAIEQTVLFYNRLSDEASLTQESDDMVMPAYKINPDFTEGIWSQLGISSQDAQELESINLIGAGTSWHAARIAQFFFEGICKIPTSVYLASEFGYMPFFPKKKSLYIFISQSGETADTLEALRLVNRHELATVALTNVPSSSIVREAGGFMLMQAGPEISVASTKAFSAQQASLYWLALHIALQRKLKKLEDVKQAEEELMLVAECLESSIETYKWEIISTLAKKYAQYDRFIFLGRHISYPFAMEAALKLKEISYIFAQCYPAGELKHGALALIDEKTPVVLFSTVDRLMYEKLLSSAQEVKARKGHLVVFAFEGQTELIKLADHAFIFPPVNNYLAPLAMTGLMQFFVYQITKELGRPIDMPRNLAKSVTVE